MIIGLYTIQYLFGMITIHELAHPASQDQQHDTGLRPTGKPLASLYWSRMGMGTNPSTKNHVPVSSRISSTFACVSQASCDAGQHFAYCGGWNMQIHHSDLSVWKLGHSRIKIYFLQVVHIFRHTSINFLVNIIFCWCLINYIISIKIFVVFMVSPNYFQSVHPYRRIHIFPRSISLHFSEGYFPYFPQYEFPNINFP